MYFLLSSLNLSLRSVYYIVFGIVGPAIIGITAYRMFFGDPYGPGDLTFDEDDDLDEQSIIKLLDAHFNMGNVPHIKEEFNRKRKEYLRND